uniref:Leucine zipper transcription factor-like protein 1 n=1 Tax=Timema douglasi TaxID=61478 RepID=A0A7R8Z618_TIMDO|nr:unnamed protein product [Timema douglasi]
MRATCQTQFRGVWGRELGINEDHQILVMNYLRFARFQRTQNLKAVEYSFKNVIESRLLEETYTAEEVQDMLAGLCRVVTGEVETELINTTHTNILLLKQLFSQAEKWHLRLQANLSELQNREELETVRAIEEREIQLLKPDRAPLSPAKLKLAPLSEPTGSVALLNMEIDRLKNENEHLQSSIEETKDKCDSYSQKINNLKLSLEEAQKALKECQQFYPSAEPEPSNLNKVEEEMSKVRSLLATNLELSVCSQQQLELELSTTRRQLAEVRAQLTLADQELERKFSETVVYTNMKMMLSKKNEQLKELRRKVQSLDPSGDTLEEEV